VEEENKDDAEQANENAEEGNEDTKEGNKGTEKGNRDTRGGNDYKGVFGGRLRRRVHQTNKERTEAPWTYDEDRRLKKLRGEGVSWSRIMEEFKNRSRESVEEHWYKDLHDGAMQKRLSPSPNTKGNTGYYT
jgi:hypothetical protein